MVPFLLNRSSLLNSSISLPYRWSVSLQESLKIKSSQKNANSTFWIAAYKEIFTIETIQYRIKKHCLNPNWCILCKKSNETTDHMFLNCSFIKSLRRKAKECTGWEHIVDSFKALSNLSHKRDWFFSNFWQPSLGLHGWKETIGYSTKLYLFNQPLGECLQAHCFMVNQT